MRHIICIALFFSTILFAKSPSNPIAEVVKIRGEVTQLSIGVRFARAVALGDKFEEDTSIVTGPKSFVKIKFIDNSEINIGPESKIIITAMKKDSVGIISLLKGRIRTEVEKNSDKPRENKFFIKTRSAALGVRGTDFQTIYNPENKMTSLLTFKGEVAMAKIDENSYEKLEQSTVKVIERDEVTKVPEIKKSIIKNTDEIEVLNKVLSNKAAVLVPPGQNAFSSDVLKKPSLPVKISPVQFEALYKNQDLEEKSVKNLNLESGSNENIKTTLKTSNQVAPSEGFYNAKTGDFAPKSGGFIDLNTALYVAPGNDAKLDSKTGVYVSNKIGNIDSDTGQYVAPKGLALDAKKGFILAEAESGLKAEKQPELIALKEDLNQSIAKDQVIGAAPEIAKIYNINEKFIRDRLSIAVWSMNQSIKANKNSTNSPYSELNSSGSVRFQIDWQMASSGRFSPLVGIDYSTVKFDELGPKGVTETSSNLLGLSYGVQYAFSQKFNFYSKFGLHQEHYLDQTSTQWPLAYTLQKVVVTRLTAGANAEFWSNEKWSADLNAAFLFTFKKRINNLIINNGTGFILEALTKYKLSDRKWLALGLKLENQNQEINGSTASTNRQERSTSGLELKYIADF